MNAITEAVTLGRAGDTETARTRLLEIWTGIGTAGDPLHRCTLAHYLADLYDDPAQALAWDIRALDAADTLSDDRAQQYHASLQVAGFYPSLHLNLADNYRRLGSWDAATEQITAARQHTNALPDDAYGDIIRTALDEVAVAITQRSTERRPSAPGPGS
ncbi:hypothetical protein [Nocardia flavorosea]|uniref:Tetratricopeptide repeat protein n=1 Tax=Nocardia flavorosea TaxID=53429 RepID=A0A846Y9L9_9NOCA|nr:hypothetical protein [Nocardia flavorosea]NKY55547.1 hypothetical protein [Nocardia flavorosea]